MTIETQALLEKALRLDAVSRAELIEALFRSFEQPSASHDALWVHEAESRLDAYDAGRMSAAPSDEVIDRAAKR